MYLAYFDESGTGKVAYEPYVVLAGIISPADRRLIDLEAYLRDMAHEFLRPEHREGFVFHAVELKNGGKTLTREKYPDEIRHQYLQHLCEIPKIFQFHIAVVGAERARFNGITNGMTPLENALTSLSGNCAQIVDAFLVKHAPENEVGALVYEQNGAYDVHIRHYHTLMKSDNFAAYIAAQPSSSLRRLERILDTAMFVKKGDSAALQVADVCAYILGRRMRRMPHDERFYLPLKERIYRAPSHLFADLKAQSDSFGT